MEVMIIISGLVSLIAVIVFFVTCNTIGNMRDSQKQLIEYLVDQGKKQNKHNEYMERIVFEIKESIKK